MGEKLFRTRLTKERIALIFSLYEKGWGYQGIAKHIKRLSEQGECRHNNIGADKGTIKKIIENYPKAMIATLPDASSEKNYTDSKQKHRTQNGLSHNKVKDKQ